MALFEHLPASLIGLLALLIRTHLVAAVGLLAAALSLAFHAAIPGTWSSLLAAAVATTIGVIWEQRKCGE